MVPPHTWTLSQQSLGGCSGVARSGSVSDADIVATRLVVPPEVAWRGDGAEGE